MHRAKIFTVARDIEKEMSDMKFQAGAMSMLLVVWTPT
jgi:hypothetical protein